MKVTIALDSFKGSLSAYDACQAIADGFREVLPKLETATIPISDGGEGLIDALEPSLAKQGFKKIVINVLGPYGENNNCALMVNGQSCIIEMAQCCGLDKIPEDKRQVIYASSFGLGQALAYALDIGCINIWIGLGGSATNDGGVGFAQALGVIFKDHENCIIKKTICADDLIKISSIDVSLIHPAIKKAHIYGTCDVTNPLLGEKGATYIFGKQKGANTYHLDHMENGMRNYASLLKNIYGTDLSKVPGAGAAGGMGAALLWFCKAELKRGIEVVLDLLHFDTHLKDSSLVFVGEGCMDGQSAGGKAPVGVALRAKAYGLPVIAICGKINDDAKVLFDYGIDAMFSICDGPISLEYSMTHAEKLLKKVANNIIRAVCININSSAD